MMRYYRGQRAVITGGSSGIGLALARALRAAGSHLLLVARDATRLADARAKLVATGGGGDIELAALDVGDQDAVERGLSGTSCDILINCAGITRPGHFAQLPIEEFERQMRTNYLGSVFCTRALLPSLTRSKRAHLAFVSSVVGFMGIFGYTAYAPTKFAIRGLAECLRCELDPTGITVTVCYPPDTDTPQHAGELPLLPAETRRIAASAKLLDADTVAWCMLRGMFRRRFEVYPGQATWRIHVLNRLFPGLVRHFIDRDVKIARLGKPA
jgi:3-dehydrosphinganine reductase